MQAVGFIVEPAQAEAVLQDGDADLIAIGRQALFDPYWPHHARQVLSEDPQFSQWPEPYRTWLQKRSLLLEVERGLNLSVGKAVNRSSGVMIGSGG